jgi:hypothetical protein
MTDLSNNIFIQPQVNPRVLESASSLVSRINELITQVSSFRNSIDASNPFSSPFSNPNLFIHRNNDDGDGESDDGDGESDDGNGDSDDGNGESDDGNDEDDVDDDNEEDGESDDGNDGNDVSVRNSLNIPPQVPPLELNGLLHVSPTVPQTNDRVIQHVVQQIRNTVLPAYRYQTQLNQMRELGFTNMINIMSALEISQGDLNEAISIYFTLSET